MLGVNIYASLIEAEVSEKKAKDWAKLISSQFGKSKKDNELEIEQLVHISPEEQSAIEDLVETIVRENRAPEDNELDLLRRTGMAADIALFGRMLAAKPAHNVEAACQVAHAISVHSIVIEDDYFTAVDDLNNHDVDAGASHIGETGFASALFYSYICINNELLLENLNGDRDLAEKTVRSLVEVIAKVSPTGKQNSFGSHAYASYIRAERGNQQPRSLSVAFLKPVDQSADDYLSAAIHALEAQATNFDKVYGSCATSTSTLNTSTGEGSLDELLDFASQ